MSFIMTKKKRYKFQVELCIKEMLEVPFVSAVLFAKVRLLDGGSFLDFSSRQEVRNHCVKWGTKFSFICKMSANASTCVLEPCTVRISVRKECKGGRSYQKLGFCDLNLAEFAGSGFITKYCLLEGYDSKRRQDNSLIQIELIMNMLSGDVLFKVPSPTNEREILNEKSKDSITTKSTNSSSNSEKNSIDMTSTSASISTLTHDDLSSISGSLASSGFGSLPKKQRPPLLNSNLIVGCDCDRITDNAPNDNHHGKNETLSLIRLVDDNSQNHECCGHSTNNLNRHSNSYSNELTTATSTSNPLRSKRNKNLSIINESASSDQFYVTANSSILDTSTAATSTPLSSSSSSLSPPQVRPLFNFRSLQRLNLNRDHIFDKIVNQLRALSLNSIRSQSSKIYNHFPFSSSSICSFSSKAIDGHRNSNITNWDSNETGSLDRGKSCLERRQLKESQSKSKSQPPISSNCTAVFPSKVTTSSNNNNTTSTSYYAGYGTSGTLSGGVGRVEVTRVNPDNLIAELLRNTNFEQTDEAAETSGLQLFIAKDGTTALGNHHMKSQISNGGMQLFKEVVMKDDSKSNR